jgi:hypothetical protein
MKGIRTTIAVSLAAVCLLAWASALRAAADKAQTKGVILDMLSNVVQCPNESVDQPN